MVPGVLYEGLGVAGFGIEVSAPVLQKKRRNLYVDLVPSESSNFEGKPRRELVDLGYLDN